MGRGSAATLRRQERIGDAGDLNHFGGVVHANDVRAKENAGGNRGGGAPDSLIGRGRGFAFLRQCGA
jgi:hypothetical protein